MTEHLNIKASQIHLFKTVPFYYQSREGEFVLYKKSGNIIEKDRAVKSKHPKLFILKKDKDDALKELTNALNANLVKEIAEGGLKQVKQALCNIVREALDPNQEKAMESMPETIDILLDAYGQDHGIPVQDNHQFTHSGGAHRQCHCPGPAILFFP